jgi:photosystem II stability/assembly factor-like uncharacterized protein
MTKRKIRLIILLCCLFNLALICNGPNLHAQSSGTWAVRSYDTAVQDTLQRFYTIQIVFFADTALGIANWHYNNRDSVRGGGWYRTTDGGASWQPFSIVGLDDISKGPSGRFALRGAHGIFVLQNGSGTMIPHVTSDSGHTWSRPPLPATFVSEIVADDLQPTETSAVQNMAALHSNGVPAGFKNLVVTTDGGSSWKRLDTIMFLGLPDSVRSRYSALDLHWIRDTVLTLMVGVNDTTNNSWYNPELWDVGLRGTVLRRIPLPRELIVLRYFPGAGSTRSVRVSDSVWMFLYRWANVDQLSLTSDAGKIWTTTPQSQPYPYTVYYLTPTRFILGNSISLDTGHTWRNWSSPYGIGSLVVLDSLHWVSANASIVAQTNDGGHTWIYKSGFRPITGFQVTGGTILLTSNTRRVLRSRDRGDNFEDVTDRLPLGVVTLTSLAVRDPDKPEKMAAIGLRPSFEMGDLQVLLHSDDTGRSWQEVRDLTSLKRGKAFSIGFVRSSTGQGVIGFLTSDSGLSSTTDGGIVWSHQTNQSRSYAMLDERFGWGVDTSAIWRTENGGMTWDTSFTLPVLYRPVRSFVAFDKMRAVALLPRTVQTPTDWRIARTSDGGKQWELVGSGMNFPYSISRFIWINSNDLYLTDGGKMWLSRNGAESFVAETPDTTGWNGGTQDGRTIYFRGKGMFARWEITDPSISSVPNPNIPIASNRQLHVEATIGGGITLHLGASNEECDLEVHNVVGALVQKQRVAKGNATIRIDNLLGGWYMLRLMSQGRVVGSQGVVVLP